MKFIIGGEDLLAYLERLTYNGVIGIFYNNTFTGLLTFLIFGIIIILSIIGLYTVIKWLITGRKKKKRRY